MALKTKNVNARVTADSRELARVPFKITIKTARTIRLERFGQGGRMAVTVDLGPGHDCESRLARGLWERAHENRTDGDTHYKL